MSGARPNNQQKLVIEPLHICVALIKEYEDHRSSSNSLFWNALNTVLGWFHFQTYNRLSTERRSECEGLVRKIQNSTTYVEQSELIDMFSALAKKAQEPKEKYASLPEGLRTLFAKDDSLWATTLHAIRTCWVAHLKRSYTKKFNKELSKLRAEYNDHEGKMKKAMKTKVPIDKQIEQTKDLLYDKLLNRQEESAIESSRLNDLFPQTLPKCKVRKFPDKIQSFKVQAYDEIPIVYNPNFHSIYYVNAIKADPVRLASFNEHLSMQFPHKKIEEQELDITAEGFFDDIIITDGVMDNTIKEDYSDSEREEKKSVTNFVETAVQAATPLSVVASQANSDLAKSQVSTSFNLFPPPNNGTQLVASEEDHFVNEEKIDSPRP